MVLHLKTTEQIEELADKAKNIEVDFVWVENTVYDFDVAPKPEPMTRFFPDKMKQHGINKDESKMSPMDALTNFSIKTCMPFTDAMRTGFGVPLWHDVFIKNETAYDQSLSNTQSLLADRSNKDTDLYTLSEHDKRQLNDTTLKINDLPSKIYKLNNPWRIVTPKGWSCLFVAPFSRDDIPIKLFTGVVDTDTYAIPVRFPFLIDKTYHGMVKVGTLVCQIIPFERVNSRMTYSYRTEEEFGESRRAWAIQDRGRKNFYRDNYRSKKR